MSLLPMNRSQPSIYGQSPDYGAPEMQDISRQRALADRLRQQGEEQLQGQMVSGRYVAPSWTQGLAKLLQQGLGAYQSQKADDAEKDYRSQKNKAYADILNGNKERQIEGTPTVTSSMPAYTPEQQDRFGSPLPDVQRTPVETTKQNFTTETPQQVADRQRAAVYEYVQKYGASPEAQLLLADFNHQRDRGEHKEDVADTRGYEEKLYNRGRADKLSDIDAERKYQDIVRADQQGFQVSQQDRQFAQQYKLQAQSQNFAAGQQSRSQAFQHNENALSREATLNNEKLKLEAASGKNKPLTEVQGKANLYGTRANEAHNELNALEGKYSPMAINAQESSGNTPLIGGLVGAATNKMLSPEGQKAQQAQRNFLTAVLRQESGAAISPTEFDVAKKQYFPQVGDSAEVIEQKRKNREDAINGFATMSSGAFKPNFKKQNGAQDGWGIEVIK